MNSNRSTIVKISIILVCAGLALGVYFVALNIYRADKLKVIVNTVPNTAEISFNDQRLSSGVHYLKPGYYKIKVSEDGFIPYEEPLEINQPSQIVNIALTPESDEATAWLQENEEQYREYEQLAGQQANQEGEAFRDKNPIISKLPFKNLLFTIGYRADPLDPSGQSIIIEVDTAEGYRQSAIIAIESWGYDPAELNITFRNYQNPFSL